MSQVILVGTKRHQSNLYAINLDMYAGANVIVKDDAENAIAVLEVIDTIDAIITECRIDKENTAVIIQQFLEKRKRPIPLLVLGEEKELVGKDHVSFLSESPDLKVLIQTVAKILGVTAKDMANKVVPDFYPIPINHLGNLNSAICDIYVRIKVSPYEYQYLKRLHQGDVLSEDIYETYKGKGLSHFYVHKEDRLQITKAITKEYVKMLSNENLSTEKRMAITSQSLSLSWNRITDEGFTEEVKELCDATIKSLAVTVQRAPDLSNFMRTLLKNPSSYLYTHAQLIVYLANHAIMKTEWGSEEQVEKIGFVTFFHDMFLEEDHLARIHSEADLMRAGLSDKDRKRVLNHALEASNLIRNYPQSPIGADQLIRQHHGTRNGIGFVDKVAANISPLSVTFMICEDFCSAILESNGEFDKEDTFKKLYARYDKGTQRKMVKTLEDLPFHTLHSEQFKKGAA
jgi:hypothetical protein